MEQGILPETHGEARPSRQLPDTMLPDMTLILVLRMEYALKDTLHDYWLRLKDIIQSVLWQDHDMKQIFTHTVFSAFCRQFTET